MPYEHRIPVNPKVTALRQSLADMRARAAAAVFRLVLICTLLGYRMVRPDGTAWPENRAALPWGGFVTGIRGILPAPAGTAGRSSAALLHS